MLSAVTTRGRWLGVASSARTDGRLGWVDGRSSALTLTAADLSIQADLSRRRVGLRSGSRLLARARVTIGRPGSSTPTGRFAVTDKLNGRDSAGCLRAGESDVRRLMRRVRLGTLVEIRR